jgi:F5/8 type C domain
MPELSRSGWIATGDSEAVSFPATNVLDADTGTEWRSTVGTGASLIVDMGSAQSINFVHFYAGSFGNVGQQIRVYLSSNGSTWGSPVFDRVVALGGTDHFLVFTAATARYFKLAWAWVAGSGKGSCKEIYAGRFADGDTYKASFISRATTSGQLVAANGVLSGLSGTTAHVQLTHSRPLSDFSQWWVSGFSTPTGYSHSMPLFTVTMVIVMNAQNALTLNAVYSYVDSNTSSVDCEFHADAAVGSPYNGNYVYALTINGSPYWLDTLVHSEMWYGTTSQDAVAPGAVLDISDRYAIVEYTATWTEPPPPPPAPDTSNWLDLWVWRTLKTFIATDQDIQFPPGYERAMRLQLAVEFARQYPGHDLTRVRKQLAQAIEAIDKINVSNSQAIEDLPEPAE